MARANGEGSVYYVKSRRRWRAAVSGRSGRRARYAKTKAEANAILHQLLADAQEYGVRKPERRTVAAYLDEWLDEARSHLRPRVWQRYEQYVRVHAVPALGAVKLTDLEPTDLQRLYARKLDAGLSRQTVKHLHTVLKTALNRAVELRLIRTSPADGAKPPSVPKHEAATLSAAQIRHFLASVREDRFYALYVLVITTGMREAELIGLRWEDVNLVQGRIGVRRTLTRVTGQGWVWQEPKTGRGRPVRLTRLAVEALREQWQRSEGTGLVFPNTVGRPVEGQNLLRRNLYPALERAGLPRVKLHELRHSAATLLMERGIPPKIVADMLGHATVGQTMDRYSHVTPDIQVAAVQAMDDLLTDP